MDFLNLLFGALSVFRKETVGRCLSEFEEMDPELTEIVSEHSKLSECTPPPTSLLMPPSGTLYPLELSWFVTDSLGLFLASRGDEVILL